MCRVKAIAQSENTIAFFSRIVAFSSNASPMFAHGQKHGSVGTSGPAGRSIPVASRDVSWLV
jgi:hypothetical protein